MSALRWAALLPSAGGLAVCLMSLTAGTPAIAAADAYGLNTSLPAGLSQRTQPVTQAAAAITAKVNARRAITRAASAQTAAITQRHIRHTHASPIAATTVNASPGCPMAALGAMGRVDEGVDYMGAGPVYALGAGTVTLVDGASGWPGGMFIAYQLDTGQYVYVAEGVTSAVSVGQRVTAGTVIANAWGSDPWMETGWAMPPGNIPEAAAYNHYTDGVPTAEGYDFRSVLYSMGCH